MLDFPCLCYTLAEPFISLGGFATNNLEGYRIGLG